MSGINKCKKYSVVGNEKKGTDNNLVKSNNVSNRLTPKPVVVRQKRKLPFIEDLEKEDSQSEKSELVIGVGIGLDSSNESPQLSDQSGPTHTFNDVENHSDSGSSTSLSSIFADDDGPDDLTESQMLNSLASSQSSELESSAGGLSAEPEPHEISFLNRKEFDNDIRFNHHESDELLMQYRSPVRIAKEMTMFQQGTTINSKEERWGAARYGEIPSSYRNEMDDLLMKLDSPVATARDKKSSKEGRRINSDEARCEKRDKNPCLHRSKTDDIMMLWKSPLKEEEMGKNRQSDIEVVRDDDVIDFLPKNEESGKIEQHDNIASIADYQLKMGDVIERLKDFYYIPKVFFDAVDKLIPWFQLCFTALYEDDGKPMGWNCENSNDPRINPILKGIFGAVLDSCAAELSMVEKDLLEKAQHDVSVLSKRLKDFRIELDKCQNEAGNIGGDIEMSGGGRDGGESAYGVVNTNLTQHTALERNSIGKISGVSHKYIAIADTNSDESGKRIEFLEEELKNAQREKVTAQDTVDELYVSLTSKEIELDGLRAQIREFGDIQQQLEKTKLDLVESQQQIRNLLANEKESVQHSRVHSLFLHDFCQQIQELRAERDNLKHELNRLIRPDLKEMNDVLEEKLKCTERDLRYYIRLLKQAGWAEFAGIPIWKIPVKFCHANYGTLWLNDQDEDCLVDPLELTEGVVQLIIETLKTENFRNNSGNRCVGLNLAEYHMYSSNFFTAIDQAEIMEIKDDDHLQTDEKEKRKLIGADKPMTWDENEPWTQDDIEEDFKARMPKNVRWAVGQDCENDKKWQWDNEMFEKKGIFFPVGCCNHWMLIVYVFADRLCEKDKAAFRKLFPRNRAKTVAFDKYSDTSDVDVDLTKDCWIVLHSNVQYDCPRHHIVSCMSMFLKQSFMARKAEPSVPLSMVNARFYVADLPQQGSSPDCGLYIGEYMRKLMNGQHFEIKVKDMVELRVQWLNLLRHLKDLDDKKNADQKLQDVNDGQRSESDCSKVNSGNKESSKSNKLKCKNVKD